MSQNATVQGLVRLQQIDHELLRIKRRLEEGPSLVERRSEKFQRGEEKVQQAHDRVQGAKARVGELELELKSKEAAIQKAASQQLEASSNNEYKALGDHMERLKKDCSGLEDQVLEALEVVETEVEVEKELREQLAELGVEKQSFEDQWKKDQVEYEKELEVIQGRRQEVATSLPKGPMMIYERVLGARDGEAVVSVEGRVCGGCRMAVTPNDMAKLQGGGELVTCKSCERILFVLQANDASS